MSTAPDLWQEGRLDRRRAAEPLAERVRPATLDEIAGQNHLLGPSAFLRRLVATGRVGSLILHGPPGTGKTTLGRCLAAAVDHHFEAAHAAEIGVARVREILEQARRRLEDSGRGTLLFLDEIHRFSKAQQDALLADVERGTISLVGATTENPAFAVNAALVSRSSLAGLAPLDDRAIGEILERAVVHPRGFPGLRVEVDRDALETFAARADGDARRALAALEIAVASKARESTTPEDVVEVDRETAAASMQRKALAHDRDGDSHYDLLSAFIKSMRGSDADAAIHWLARLLEGGEDPRIVARRIAILASEDIGLADPQAIEIAAAAWAITERVGMPECQLTLAEAAIYMCQAPKSNAVAEAIWSAMAEVREGRTLPVPEALRDRTANRMLDRAATRIDASRPEADAVVETYRNPHSAADGVGTTAYLSEARTYYRPGTRGFEVEAARRLEARKAAVAAAPAGPTPESPDAAAKP
jgi:putative ATPase